MLDVSNQHKTLKGAAKAFMGLDICEEKVLYIFNTIRNLETGFQRASDRNEVKIEKMIS